MMRTIPARGFFLGCALIALASFAEGQVLFKIGSPHTDSGQHVVVDDDGNILIAGWFQGTVDFDPGPEIAERTAWGNPADPLTGKDAVDIFLAKYDPAGKLLWVVVLGAEGPDRPHALALDGHGNAVLAGSFSGEVDFDPSGKSFLLDGDGRPQAFIAKYGAEGMFLWAFKIDTDPFPSNGEDGDPFDVALDLSVGPEDRIAVTGAFRGTVDFDPSGRSDAESVFTSNSGSSDIFIAVYSHSGDYLRGFVPDGPGENKGRAVRFGANGDILAAGCFSDSVDFDPGPDVARLQSAGRKDIFIARYEDSGKLLWARRAGGPDDDVPASGGLTLDGNGNILMTGEFRETAAFDSSLETPPLVSHGNSDIFTAKYTTDGDFLWAVGAGSVHRDFGAAVAVDKNGNVFVTGSFAGASDFDPGEKEIILLPVAGPDTGDIFLVNYDPSGGLLWARSFGGPENDPDNLQAGLGLAVDGRGNAFVTGRFHLSADFDPGASSEFLTSDGCADAFLAQFDGDGKLVAARLRHPPLQFRGYKYLNRSLSQFEYINILSWSRNPDDPGAVSFRIYLVEDGVRSLETELDVSSTAYWHRNVARDKSYHYICTAVDVWGNEGGTAEIVVR